MADAFSHFDLTGKTALITGASSGLGAHFAHVLGAAGAQIIIAARREDRLAEVADSLDQQGIKAMSLQFDVTDFTAIPEKLDHCEQKGFPVNILVNNAGMNAVASVDDVTLDAYDAVMDTNVKGPFFWPAKWLCV